LCEESNIDTYLINGNNNGSDENSVLHYISEDIAIRNGDLGRSGGNQFSHHPAGNDSHKNN